MALRRRYSSLTNGVACAALLATLLAGCGGDGSASSDGAIKADGGGVADVPAYPVPYCATDPRAQNFAVGVSSTSADGLVRMQILTISPAPPETDNYQWTVQMADNTGAAMDGATMTIVPYMPDHGHGTSIVPAATSMGGGHYAVSNVYLFMEGIWTVTFHVTTSSGMTDTVVFTFCVAM